MAEKIDEKALKVELASQFEIGAINRVKPLNADLGFWLNDFGGTLFMVESAHGDYVAKIFAPSQPAPQCMLEPRLMRLLAQNDFKQVAPVLSTKSGADVGRFANRSVFLLNHFPCTRQYRWNLPGWNAADCSTAGALLASLHSKLSLITPETLESWHLDSKLQPATLGNSGDVGVSSIRPYLKKWLSDAFALFESHRFDDSHGFDSSRAFDSAMPVVQLATSKRQFILKMLEAAELRIKDTSSRDSEILVHGDYHAGNLLWRTDRIDAVIDFENAHFEHRVYDLAYSTVMFASDWQKQRPGKPFDNEFANALYTSYIKTSENNDEDVMQLLSQYIQLTASLIVLWLLHDSMRSNRFHTPLTFLLENIEQLPAFSTTICGSHR